jgi:hypothetical protein
MNMIRNSISILILAMLLALNLSGCKSKKKAMEAQAAAERARIEQEAADRRQKEETQRKEAEETARREAEARQKDLIANAPKARLGKYFDSIANAESVSSSNSSISEALTLFASPETPVLIVISEENGQKDYDRPTTIQAYLNYLKDQKKNMNQISNLEFDGAGKITEVELRKK